MENKEISELIRQFDNFVQCSLNRKQSEQQQSVGRRENKIQTYLTEMEKRLKLKSRSPANKLENLLKPMKQLKSFVSVKEFMESLGTSACVKIGEKEPQKEGKSIKLEYQNVRGGFYLQKIEEHLKSKQFKRSAKNSPYFITELQNRPLENSQYRTWVENTLAKISLKNDQLFKNHDNRIAQSRVSIERESVKRAQKDCLLEEHQLEYANQFKVVPRIRQMCTQEYQNFSKISTLLTTRLRKILKTNSTARNTTLNTKTDLADTCLKKSTTKVIRGNKENSLKGKMNRIKTAQTLRREQSEIWRKVVNKKLKDIICE